MARAVKVEDKGPVEGCDACEDRVGGLAHTPFTFDPPAHVECVELEAEYAAAGSGFESESGSAVATASCEGSGSRSDAKSEPEPK